MDISSNVGIVGSLLRQIKKYGFWPVFGIYIFVFLLPALATGYLGGKTTNIVINNNSITPDVKSETISPDQSNPTGSGLTQGVVDDHAFNALEWNIDEKRIKKNNDKNSDLFGYY